MCWSSKRIFVEEKFNLRPMTRKYQSTKDKKAIAAFVNDFMPAVSRASTIVLNYITKAEKDLNSGIRIKQAG
jgi:hypothetical protein